MKLEGKVAIITGAARGIGRGIALRFAQEGADIVILDINLKGVESVTAEVEALGRRAFAAEVDVTNSAAVNDLVNLTLEQFGKIDILINNAGILKLQPFWEVSDEDWDRIIKVHLYGGFYCSRAVAPHMMERREGKIVNITGANGMRGSVERAAYGAAKAGLTQLTRVMAVDLAPYDINVNAIAPGPVLTEMVKAVQATGRLKFYPNMIPLKRWCTPEDITAAAVFLCSPEASYITSHILHVDGGFYESGMLEH